MDIPNFKDILAKLSVFKNNTALLVPVIVALIGILLLVAAPLLGGKLVARIQDESISRIARKVGQFKRDPVKPVQPESLEARREAHADDANEISALGMQTTMRDLLSYDIFPEIDVNNFSGLIFVEFGQKYRAGIEALITSVNGRDCPTQVEIDKGLESSSARTNRRMGMYGAMGEDPYGMMGPGGPAGAMGPAPRRLGTVPGMRRGPQTEIDLMIVDQMCTERAASALVYVNPIDISGYEHWEDYKYDVNMVSAVKDAWYHQLAYWVIEDIFNTIAVTNAGHDSLLTAPVKRFSRISFTMGLKRPGSRGSRGGAVIRAIGGRRAKKKDEEDSDRPAYVLTDKDGLTESLTGRLTEAEGAIDVIHFNVAVVVASKDILLFMQEFCSAKEHKFSGYPDGSQPPQTFKHNQITILESKIAPLNPNDMLHYYHRYGNDPVVELDLICEYIFNSQGCEPIKPQAIKDTIAGLDES
ncbi:MAG: hypothetical protein ACYSWO_10835 [Planctomycetota bacterium]|jgi:hypothetical protein